MQIVIGAQAVITALAIVIAGLLIGWQGAVPILYGASLGILVTALTKRSADRALSAAEENPRYGLVAMYSGLVLRYAVVILGLLIGFQILRLSAVSMIGGFVLTIVVLVVTSPWVKSEIEAKGTN